MSALRTLTAAALVAAAAPLAPVRNSVELLKRHQHDPSRVQWASDMIDRQVRSLSRLVPERDPFIRLAGTGLAALLGMQALINVGVAVRLLPAKGMTLPLISYGGSSLIAAGFGLGMLLAMTRTRPRHEMDDILGPAR